MKLLLCAFCGLFLSFCGGDDNQPITDDDGDQVPEDNSIACPIETGLSEMVVVRRADGSSFCIDKYEVHHLTGSLGNVVQSDDDAAMTDDGSSTGQVASQKGEEPLTGVSWYQALALCDNRGAVLCERADWERACRGPELLVYPYGDEYDQGLYCNGFDRLYGETFLTGSLPYCISPWGIYDMSGNVEEWVYDAAERVPLELVLRNRFRMGGSFKTNADALHCVGSHSAMPNVPDEDRGFRCCLNL